MAEERLSGGQIISYALPAFGTGMMLITLGVYLPKFCTDSLLVGPALLSWVFLIGRFWDAVTDPAMGHISDRTRTRWGRRRPYFLISALPIAVIYYLLWSPSTSLSETGLFVHLLVFYIMLHTFKTVLLIPYASLGAEMSMQYHERTRLFGARQVFGIAGTALGILAPAIFIGITGNERSGYSMMAVVFGVVTMALIFTTFARVRENPAFQTREPIPFLQGLKTTLKNKAFIVLLIVYLFNLVGSSFLAMLTPYIGQYVIKAPWAVPYVILCFMGGSIGSIFLWVRMAKKYGKKKTWTISMCIAAVAYCVAFSYHEGTWIRWMLLAVIAGTGAGCAGAIGPSISADVIDSDELETGRRREGAFFGIWALLDKAAIGLAIFIGLRILDSMGYVPNVEQTDRVIFSLKFLYTLLPGITHAAGALMLQKFPITQEVHAKIRAELDARAAAEKADSG